MIIDTLEFLIPFQVIYWLMVLYATEKRTLDNIKNMDQTIDFYPPSPRCLYFIQPILLVVLLIYEFNIECTMVLYYSVIIIQIYAFKHYIDDGVDLCDLFFFVIATLYSYSRI